VERCCRGGEATDGSITQSISFACWITKVMHTRTHTEYVILLFHGNSGYERWSLLRNTHIACIVLTLKQKCGRVSLILFDFSDFW
jgi:hypothetical protein